MLNTPTHPYKFPFVAVIIYLNFTLRQQISFLPLLNETCLIFCGQIDNDHLHRVKCKFLLSYQPLHWFIPCISYLHGRLTGCIKKQCIVARESSCDSKSTTLSCKCIHISSTVCATKSCCFKKAIVLFNISGSFKVADGWSYIPCIS